MNIWEKWEEHYRKIEIDPTKICKDGIIDETKYRGAHKKVLFVLREVNNFPGGDLREMLRGGPHYQVWFTIGRWAAGILKDFPPYPEIDKQEMISDSLSQVASINLKKATGGNASDLVIINAFAYRDQALLLDQIIEIGPDIIVACGTFDALMWILEMDVNPDEPHAAAVHDHITGALVVPFRHPGRVGNKATYEELHRLIMPAK